MSLDSIVAGKGVVVCAGAGGVGKTTSAAAIGLRYARLGRRVLVLTIDPARRLADALGLPEAGDEAHRVELAGAEGQLYAMMLDAKRTFDHLIVEHAPTAEAARLILDNRIYRQLSGAVSGSQEYMAMEKLWELHATGEYDLLVLDTPPARNALDFLEAPGRVTRFIDSKTLRLLLRPGVRAGRIGLRALGSGSHFALSMVERLTGVALLADLSEFLGGFDGMYDGFRERAEQVNRLLSSAETTFVLVTAPEAEPIAEAEEFWRALVTHGMPFGGAIVNKVHPSYLGPGGGRRGLRTRALRTLEAAGVASETAHRAADNLLAYQALADRDRVNIGALRDRIAPQPLIEVPYLEHDIDSLAAVEEVSAHLTAP